MHSGLQKTTSKPLTCIRAREESQSSRLPGESYWNLGDVSGKKLLEVYNSALWKSELTGSMNQDKLITLIYKRGEKEDIRLETCLFTEYREYDVGTGTAMRLRTATKEIRLTSVESLKHHLILKSRAINYGTEGNVFPTIKPLPSDILK